MLATIITVAIVVVVIIIIIIIIIILDDFLTSNPFLSSDVFFFAEICFHPTLWRPASNRSGGSTQFDQGGLEGGRSLLLSEWFRGEGLEEGPGRAMAIGMMFKGGLERRP